METSPGPSVTPSRTGRTSLVLAAGAVALAIALGVVLRLADPLSSPVVPAEDPYNHMALVREHLRTGDLEPLNSGQNLYPPGLHAFLAAAWVYTGLDLYDITLLGPMVFGAIGLLGMAALLWRTSGPVAAFVATLALAVAPEAIFRTNMMSPTALDLAILPGFLYALLRILAGRLGWTAVAAPTAILLAFAHPWLLAIFCAAGMLFLLASLLFPWTSARGEPLSLRGIAYCIAVLGVGLGVALLMPTFGGSVNLPIANPAPLGLAIAALALAPVLVLTLWRRAWSSAWLTRAPPGVLVRLGLSVAIAALLLGTVFVAVDRGMPALVDLPRMFGWPILILAAAALVALPFIASPIANLAAGLAAATLPFVIFNPLRSEFLSHRTAVFLGFALIAVAGVAAGALVRAAVQALHSHTATRTTPARHSARPFLFAVAPVLLVTTLLGGSVYAGTPDAYPGGWYRLYTPCEMDALRDVARQANAQPDAIIVTGDWQAKLVLAALTTDADRVWYKGEVFTSEESRGDLVATMAHDGRPVIVVVDRYLRVETPDADTSFLASPPWQPIGSWCAGMGVEQPRTQAYATDRGAS